MDELKSPIQDLLNAHQRPSKGLGAVWAALAWLVIVVVCVLWISQERITEAFLENDISEEARLQEEGAGDTGTLVSMEDDILGKIVVGFNALLPAPNGLRTMEYAAPLEKGGSGQQLAWVILQARFEGIAAGREALEVVKEKHPEPPVAQAVLDDVQAAFSAAEQGTQLEKATRERLETTLGYFGEIAVSLSDQALSQKLDSAAIKAAITLMAIVVVFGFTGLGGFAGLIVLIILAGMHKVHGKVLTGSGPGLQNRHGVYAETFAIWLIVFFGLQILVGLSGIQPALLMTALGFFLSLATLAWPVLRGKTWRQVRTDIGLHSSSGSVIEPVVTGVSIWAMAIPLMGIGLLLTFLLSYIVKTVTGQAPQPSHPVQQMAAGAGGMQIVLLFLVASVAAPIVEELMFRGVLYTHLRGLSKNLGSWISIGVSILVSSAIFAAIHPQGLVFMPPLMGLAAGFCIGREWRGSLYGPMIAHGIHNALLITLNVMLFM